MPRAPVEDNDFVTFTKTLAASHVCPRSVDISVRMRVRKPVEIETIGRSADKNVRAPGWT
jgi:hypothetical protein